jgi:hypothetical protein
MSSQPRQRIEQTFTRLGTVLDDLLQIRRDFQNYAELIRQQARQLQMLPPEAVTEIALGPDVFYERQAASYEPMMADLSTAQTGLSLLYQVLLAVLKDFYSLIESIDELKMQAGLAHAVLLKAKQDFDTQNCLGRN